MIVVWDNNIGEFFYNVIVWFDIRIKDLVRDFKFCD